MMQINKNGHTVRWFINPRDVGYIDWNESGLPDEQTVHFEPNGDKRSSYIWGVRLKDGKYARVGKIIRQMVFLPFLMTMGELLGGLALVGRVLSSNSVYVEIFCLYGMLFLLCVHFIFNYNDDRLVDWM